MGRTDLSKLPNLMLQVFKSTKLNTTERCNGQSTQTTFTHGCSAKKRGVGTAFPHQIKMKTALNSSNEVSIGLQEFPHWIFLFHSVFFSRAVRISAKRCGRRSYALPLPLQCISANPTAPLPLQCISANYYSKSAFADKYISARYTAFVKTCKSGSVCQSIQILDSKCVDWCNTMRMVCKSTHIHKSTLRLGEDPTLDR